MLSVSRASVYRLADRKIIPSVPIPSSEPGKILLRFRREQIEAKLAEWEQAGRSRQRMVKN